MKRQNVLKIYTKPSLNFEKIYPEDSLAAVSIEILPGGNETGIIQVMEWNDIEEIPSIDGDSRW